jgi:hypothetical protein
VLLFTCIVLTGVAALTRAEESAPPDKAAARELTREGIALSALGDHIAALKRFQSAYVIFPSPITGLAVAREQLALALLVEAYGTLGDVLMMPPRSTESASGARARLEAEALRAQVLARTPVLEIEVRGTESEVLVLLVDGNPISMVSAASGIRVNPGTHLVVAQFGVSAPAQRSEVHATEGERVKVSVEIPPQAASVRPQSVPTSPIPVPSVAESQAAVAPRAESNLLRQAVGVVIFASGVGCIGASAGLGLSAQSNYEALKRDHCPTGACDPVGIAGISEARNQGTRATIVFGVGAALALGGAVLWLTTPTDRSSKPAHASASLGFGFGGVTIAGRF